jgi:3'(2'), 5'-bisphosphate nucleotidase
VSLPASDAGLAAELAGAAGQLLLTLRAQIDDPGCDPKLLGQTGDRLSNQLILDRLAGARPDDAVLSEEAVDDQGRLRADRVWIVDPLDGTREFAMPGRTDWAVHVALWRRDTASIVAAAVAQPALGQVYASEPPPVVESAAARPVILVSDSRPPAFATRVAEAVGGVVRPMGSAGAKAMAILRGEAHAYLHAGGQWEWDSAAPVGVAQAAGLHTSRIDGSELLYNQPHPYLPDLLLCRPELAAALLEAVRRAAPPDA